MLNVSLLGAPRLKLSETSVRMKRRKSLALLSYLVMKRQTIARDTLAALLWGDHEHERARSELRIALWEINKTLGEDWLIVNRDSVQVNPDKPVFVDVHEFRREAEAPHAHPHHAAEICVACLPHYEAAYKLYTDDFLAGFSIAGCPEFDDWQLLEAESLRQNYWNILQKLVWGNCALQELKSGIRYTQRWLELDSFNEEAHRWLMALQAWGGNKAGVVQQYQLCQQILNDELGVQPSDETTSLFENLKAGILPDVPFIYYDVPDSVADVRHNLPPQPNPFRGRSEEVAQLIVNLQQENCRLLTLVGLGGAGKTRLAIHTARQMTANFTDGVFFVSLMGVFTEYAIITEIADSIGLQFNTAEDIQVQLLRHLAAQKMLLILDNFEHLIEHVRLIDQILTQAPQVKMLVTSRLPLMLKLEWTFTIDQMVEGAEQLFIDSAVRADTHFVPTDDDRATIAAICQQLAGMPLAIELAATWVHVLSLPEILAEVRQNVELLTSEWADIPERHRNLQATFDYSWGLLDTNQQQALLRLAIFPSSFSYESARVVASVSLNVLSGLAARALVKRNAAGRYQLHELIRQFALLKLRQMPAEHQTVMDAFIKHINQALVRHYDGLAGERVVETKASIVQEIDSVRAAFALALESGQAQLLYEALPTLHLFYDYQSWTEEGRALFERLAKIAPPNEALAVRAQVYWARFLRFTGNYEMARSILTPIVEAAPAYAPEMAIAHYSMANLYFQDNFDLAMHHARQAIEINEELNDALGLGMALCLSAEMLTQKGELDGALAQSKRAAEVLLPLGQSMQFAFLQTTLCLIHSYRGDLDTALVHGRLAVELYKRFNNIDRVLRAQLFVAHVLDRMGSYDDAQAILDETITSARAVNASETLAHALTEYGINAHYRKDYQQAVETHEEVIALSQKLSMGFMVDTAKVNIASSLIELGEYARAERLLLQAKAQFESMESDYGIICVTALMGKGYSLNGEYTKAEQALRQSIELAEKGQMTVDWLTGVMYFGLLRYQQQEYESALQLINFVMEHPATENQVREEASEYHRKIVLALGQEQARQLLIRVDANGIWRWL